MLTVRQGRAPVTWATVPQSPSSTRHMTQFLGTSDVYSLTAYHIHCTLLRETIAIGTHDGHKNQVSLYA